MPPPARDLSPRPKWACWREGICRLGKAEGEKLSSSRKGGGNGGITNVRAVGGFYRSGRYCGDYNGRRGRQRGETFDVILGFIGENSEVYANLACDRCDGVVVVRG